MKVKVIEIKTKSVKKYHNKIRPYLKDIINTLKNFDSWKVRLILAANFTFYKDNYEEHLMHSKTDNKETMINDKAHKVTEKHFKSLLNIYQNNLETSMRDSDFVLCSFMVL